MIRLPRFDYRAPRTVAEAAELLAAPGGDAMILAGGTDLLPNMKRRQREAGPDVVPIAAHRVADRGTIGVPA